MQTNLGKHRNQERSVSYGSSPADRLLSRLDGVRRTGPSMWRARCPTRDDRNPSLDIRECDDGRLLIIDRAGISGANEIVSAVGLTLGDLFPDRPQAGTRPPPFDWRGFREHSRTALVAVGLALRDIAAGRELSEDDREYLASVSDHLLRALDIAEASDGRH